MKRSIAVAAALGFVGVYSIGLPSWGQGIPRACSATQPATMASGGPIQGLSVIAASSDSLYVLYDAETRGRRNVGLLVLDGVSSGQVQVNTFNVGEGTVGRRSLAIVGQTLVGAYKRADGRIAAFTRPVGRGSITELPADAALTATSVPSVAVNGRNVLISWAGSSGASHLWTVSPAGAAVGAVRSITSNIARGEVTGALGGAVFGSATTTSQFSVASGRAARAVGSAPANVSSFSVAASGRNALVVTVANGTARAHFLRSATDRGRTIELGPAVSATHAAVAPTAWGAFSLWPSANTLSIRALRADGRTLGPSFAMGTFRATQPEAFSAAAVGNTVFAFWAEGGNVQMLRINCYS